MDYINIFLSKDFWNIVYIISKWIFIILSATLFIASILLFIKISKFRQKLNIKEAFNEYQKQPSGNKETKNANISIQETQIKETVKLKWNDITAKMESINERDWRIAVLHADALFDDVLKKKGIAGETLKERLNSVKNQNMINLNEVWQAHKIRNEIAHNSDFILTKQDAADALKNYKRALIDLKAL